MSGKSLYIILFGVLVSCSESENNASHTAHTNFAKQAESQDLMLNDSQIKLANITTERVSIRTIGQSSIVTGKLVSNQDLIEVISSRSPGRIEKLYIKDTGRTIQQGQALYDLYSETILTLQKEYLLALEQFEKLGSTESRYGTFFKAAERKLLLYGLTKKQIESLAKTKNVQPRVTFVAPASGVVTEINVSEGQSVEEGSSLYKIESISTLWVEAELYPNEASLVEVGDKITVSINGFDNSPVEANVTFLSPEYRANSQITIMRASINNKELKFQSGMEAQVMFTHSAKKSIAIPVDAVIRDGNGTHVYVQKGKNTFRPQMVKTGIADFSNVEIVEGLSETDTIAATGAYLLYSEFVLKKGTDPMAGHRH